MRVLIIHHLERCWDLPMRRYGTSFEEQADKVLRHIEAQEPEYDRIILTRWEEPQLGQEHYDQGIAGYIDVVEEYGYGWEKIPGEEGIDWAEGGNHSRYVMLCPWMHELYNAKAQVDLCGAFDGECIEDMELALQAVGVKYKRLNHLIV